jgi:hypothetical protein
VCTVVSLVSVRFLLMDANVRLQEPRRLSHTPADMYAAPVLRFGAPVLHAPLRRSVRLASGARRTSNLLLALSWQRDGHGVALWLAGETPAGRQQMGHCDQAQQIS